MSEPAVHEYPPLHYDNAKVERAVTDEDQESDAWIDQSGTPMVRSRDGLVSQRRYGHFLERLGGWCVDTFIVSVIFAPVSFLLGVLTSVVTSSAIRCSDVFTNGSGGTCLTARRAGFLEYAVTAFVVLTYMAVYHFIIIRPLSSGATLGMKLFGLRAISARRHIAVSPARMWIRAFFAWTLSSILLAGGLVWLLGVSIFHETLRPRVLIGGVPSLFVTSAMTFVFLLSFGSSLWSLFDPKYQTLHDKFSGTIVVSKRVNRG